MPSLIISESPGESHGKQFVLASRTVAAGRDPAREIQIIDPKVSRKHFIIRKEGETHVIAEAKAKNGVYVNGVQITERTLEDGDRIQVGDSVLTYYVSDRIDRSDAVQHHRIGRSDLREGPTVLGT